jgi:hypothetical protein
MTKTIEGDLIITEDTTFKESIIVTGNIKGRYNLNVIGDIDAGDINACNINARNINAWDINAWDINACNINACDIDAWDINASDIDAWDINASDINARDIICEKRIRKSDDVKTISRVFILNKSSLEKKEQIK